MRSKSAPAVGNLAERLLDWLTTEGATIAEARAALAEAVESEFRRMWHEGASRDRLAEHFGVRRETVSERARRLGLPSRTARFAVTDQDRAMIALVHDNLSNAEIAERLGVAASYVVNRLSRLRKAGIEIPRRNMRDHDARAAAVRELARSGMSDDMIASALGIGASTVSHLRGTQEPRQQPRDTSQAQGALDEIDQTILAMRREHHTASEIAQAVGRSAATVRRRMRRLDDEGYEVHRGQRPAYSEQEDAQILTLRRKGATVREIADALGRTCGSVYGRMDELRKRGVEIPPRPRPPTTKDRVLAILSTTDTPLRSSEIWRRLSIDGPARTRAVVYQILARLVDANTVERDEFARYTLVERADASRRESNNGLRGD